MPTFERCQACVNAGVPMDEAPIVPEGKRCPTHDRAKDHNHCVTCGIIIPDGWRECFHCFRGIRKMARK